MRSFWQILGASITLALCGCNATTSAYVKANEGFTEAVDGAKASVKLLADQRHRVARVAYANNVVVLSQPTDSSAEKEFSNFVCQGAGSLSQARASLRVLGLYGKSITDLLEKPEQDVASLLESIATVEERQATLKIPKPSSERSDCADEVTALLELKVLTTPETGFLAVVATAKALADGLNKVAVAGLGMADEAARARALKRYITANKDNIDGLLEMLGEKSAEYNEICKAVNSPRVLCKMYKEKPDGAAADYIIPEPNKLAAQLLWQKWASLRQPYLHFLAFRAYAPTAASPQDKARAMDMAMRVHRQLGEFDALRTTASPQLLAQGLREAQQGLLDVADGKVPAGTGWGRIMAWVDALDAIASGLGDAKKAVEGDQ